MREQRLSDSLSGPSYLPRRRWRIRAPRALLMGILGAVLGAALAFTAWWFRLAPLILVAPAALLGGYLLLPPTLYLAMDERGVAIVRSKWGREKYLWIPQDRLIRLESRQGWLLATGTNVEQQGDVSWAEAARQAGTTVPPWLQLHFKSGLASQQVAAPIHLLDQIARDEIELWLYQQGK